MKNNLIYFNGCSFTYGMGIDEDRNETLKKRFSKTLADSLEMREMNNAVPGSCNARIARRAFNDIRKYTPELVIIVWSDPARTEFVPSNTIRSQYDGEDTEQVRPLSIYGYPSFLKNSWDIYYKNISSLYMDVLKTLHNMSTTKMLCDSLSIPCIQLQFTGGFYKDLQKCRDTNHPSFRAYRKTLLEELDYLSSDKHIIGLKTNTSMDSISGCEINPSLRSTIKSQEGHPAGEAHNNMSSWLANYIRENGLR